MRWQAENYEEQGRGSCVELIHQNVRCSWMKGYEAQAER